MHVKWTAYFDKLLPEILDEIKTYVEMETPSGNKSAVDILGSFIANRFQELGCSITIIKQNQYGNQLRIEYGSGEKQLMVLGHFDTVKDLGTLKNEPWRIEDGKAYGPGVYDMKAGIVFSYFALKALIENGVRLNKRIVFFWNTDEEVGSPSSANYIREEAKKSDAVLVVEPAHGNGLLKTSRKGGGDFIIKAYGRAAHAGNEHPIGVNAIIELASQLPKIQAWTDYEKGTTLSVGLIKGGSASNVVPDYAEAVVDVRISLSDEAKRVTELFNQITPIHSEARIEVQGGIQIPPMERTTLTEGMFKLAQQEACAEDIELDETAVGGTSDGNLTSSVGAATLDGLGPIGDGAHATHEHILIDPIPSRIALLLRLFCKM